MDIKDYIHYYIGQKFIFDNKVWTMVRVSTTLVRGVRNVKGEDKPMQVYHHEAKLLLRRLEDMTDEEALHIGKLGFFDRPINYPNDDFTVIRQPSCYAVRINNDWFQREVRIGFNTGNVWTPHVFEKIQNQPKIFHYLLKQGFDIFGLIDASLAIDSKSINK